MRDGRTRRRGDVELGIEELTNLRIYELIVQLKYVNS